MFEYSIQAYDETDLGKVNVIQVTVQARTKDAAIEHAKQIESRTNYSVTGIKDLGGEFKKVESPSKGKKLKKG
jgi:hypothetical protein